MSARGRQVLVLLALTACAGKLPPTRHYALAPVTGEAVAATGEVVLVLEPFTTEPAYDDERIVYRPSPYRLDYYNYHRWSASPGTLVGNYLEQALERTGRFRAVVRELSPQAPVVLGGRVVAIEEIDTSRTRWVGRIVVELTLTEPRTGAVLWTEQFDEIEPLTTQTPEGLARALSVALARIAARTAPRVDELATAAARRLGDGSQLGRVLNDGR